MHQQQRPLELKYSTASNSSLHHGLPWVTGKRTVRKCRQDNSEWLLGHVWSIVHQLCGMERESECRTTLNGIFDMYGQLCINYVAWRLILERKEMASYLPWHTDSIIRSAFIRCRNTQVSTSWVGCTMIVPWLVGFLWWMSSNVLSPDKVRMDWNAHLVCSHKPRHVWITRVECWKCRHNHFAFTVDLAWNWCVNLALHITVM